MLPKINAKTRQRIKRKIKRNHYHAPRILGLKQTGILEGCSHRGLVVGLTKVNNQHGAWV